jgi:hypothetical protein
VALAIGDRLLFFVKVQTQMSPDDVHPISGSTRRGDSGSKSRTQAFVLAKPDCMAVLDGL